MTQTDPAPETAPGGAAPGDRPARKGMVLWSQDDAVELFESGTMSFPTFDDADAAAIVEEGLDLGAALVGNIDEVLFRGAGDDGFSLVRAWFAPHYVLPRHSHDADCLYYLLEGTILMGNRTIEAGNGFFVAAGAPYAYEAGPEGATVLEFRQRTTFDMSVTPGNIDRFRRLAAAGADHAEQWAELRAARTDPTNTVL